ncbi:TPA: LLM class flavin-dependent oxidoreductase [Bacillus cereus]|nr:LLM class flavin-dependent oxidoreductase [Bacillus cereus]
MNIVTGGVPAELHADGVHLEHSQRYKYTEEFLKIFNPIMKGKEIDFEGNHINVENANILFPSLQNPRPPIFFGGASDEAMEVAVKHSDVYLMWAEPHAHQAKVLVSPHNDKNKLGCHRKHHVFILKAL